MLTNALRSLAASALFAVFSSALVACSPTYDWRTISNNTSGYSVDLPGRPASDARSVDVDGTPMQMHMQTAEVGGAVFVIGTLDLPDAQAATQQKALGFLRDGLARNVGVPPDARSIAVPLAAGGSVPGIDMQLSGKAGAKDETRTIHARLVAKGAHAYQLAIVGREQPAVEQVDQFFQSFKLH
ncbi:hypothetical protein F4827_001021 [Paraburkholderia bannensis]|jgi:hypothetical protein|uniref:DUF1795 domain-containing protein n=1 Tax=Paraburkholderia bannensis TaxID=765414 RepID=A0A7W9TVP5_9BURK|nr:MULTISPECIES: hypothetical protein [Paraburkholderia]MBB3256195.1 hypothetical protein [Paraburkholderia sp. WP4_3_2]MBB6101195.1 hypothetical protein [Paraburkholderia bannensis]